MLPDGPPTQRHRDAVQNDGRVSRVVRTDSRVVDSGGHQYHYCAAFFCNALSSSGNCPACQPWKVCAPTAIVSETPTVGLLASRAMLLSCSVFGDTPCRW